MNYVGNRIAIFVPVISALVVLSACGGESNPVSNTLSQAESALLQLTVWTQNPARISAISAQNERSLPKNISLWAG